MHPIVSTLLVCASLLACLAPVPAFADLGDCGQPQSTGPAPTATDALAILRSAVGSPSNCDTEPCICDVTGDDIVTSSDALRLLVAAIGQAVPLTCNCDSGECTILGGTASVAASAQGGNALTAPPRQVRIEIKLIGIDTDSFDELGIDLLLDTSSPITTDAGPPPGGTNGDGRTLAVDSNATGGPVDLQYLLYGENKADGALPVLNSNFASPFDAIKTFFLLPTEQCVVFDESAVTEPQGFPGMTPVENLPPIDAGFGGDELLFFMQSPNETMTLLSTIEADNRNTVLTAPTVTAFSGQTVLQMVDEMEPTLPQLDSSFRSNIQAVTQNPFGNFTGPVLDIVPVVGDDSVTIVLRPATETVSFFFSTAFNVNGVPADAEIPVLRRSRNVSSIVIPMGQTVVIGGLLRDGESIPERGVPLLGNIPVVGSLVRNHFDPPRQTLLIILTPMIIDPSAG